MECSHCEDKIIDVLLGVSSLEQNLEVKAHILECEHCKSSYDVYQILLCSDDHVSNTFPESSAEKIFNLHLEALVKKPSEQKMIRWWNKLEVKVAAIVIISISSYLMGTMGSFYKNGSNADQSTPAFTYNFIKSEQWPIKSASERIATVTNSTSSGKLSDDVIKALLAIILEDSNTNVRLAAFKVLSNSYDDKRIHPSLRKALEHQDNVMLQILIAKVLIDQNEVVNKAWINGLIRENKISPEVNTLLQ